MGLKERRHREKEARREEILKAARELLHKKGINGASMNQIAKKAELGVATLYSYFTNKEDLFLTIQQEGLDLLREMTAEAIGDETDPRKKLKKTAFAYLLFSQTRINYYYIINYFVSTPEILFEPQLKTEIDEQAARSIRGAESIIEDGIKKGIFKKTNVKRTSIMFSGLVHGLTQYQKFKDTILADDSHEKIFEFSVDKFIESLCK